MTAENQFTVLNGWEAGIHQDPPDFSDPPVFRNLTNFWLNSKRLQSRPHLLSHLAAVNIKGLGVTHDNKLFVATDGLLYVDGGIAGAISGSGELSYDYSKDSGGNGLTIITIGGNPVVWNGIAPITLSHTNVKAVATGHGFNKRRLFFIKSDEPRTVYFTPPGGFDDTGTLIIDSDGYNDGYTEGGRIRGFISDIFDIQEFAGNIVVFARRGIISIRADQSNEAGYFPETTKTRDNEIWDVKTKRYDSGILFLNGEGLYIYSIGETGPFTQRLNIAGNNRTITNQLVEAEAVLGVDNIRKLFLLRPNNADNVWVFHLNEEGIYTDWNMDFNSIVTINNKVYSSIPGEVYRWDDYGDGVTGYSMSMVSGLTHIGSPQTRKRIKRVGSDISFSRDLQYEIDMHPEKIKIDAPSYSTINALRDDADDISTFKKIERYIGSSGRNYSFQMNFINKGLLSVDNIWIQWLNKTYRGISN